MCEQDRYRYQTRVTNILIQRQIIAIFILFFAQNTLSLGTNSSILRGKTNIFFFIYSLLLYQTHCPLLSSMPVVFITTRMKLKQRILNSYHAFCNYNGCPIETKTMVIIKII